MVKEIVVETFRDELGPLKAELSKIATELSNCQKETKEASKKSESMIADEVSKQLAKSKQLFSVGIADRNQMEDVFESILGETPEFNFV